MDLEPKERVQEEAVANQPVTTPEPQPIEKTSERHVEETVRVVVYKLAGHEHAVDVRRVREILRLPDVSPVIGAPGFEEGVIKLRGRIVPIVDLKKRLHLPSTPKTLDTCVIVVWIEKRMVGIVVDSAFELLTVPTRLIEPPNEMVGGVRTRFIAGVSYVNNRFLVFLNLDKILTDEKERREFEAGHYEKNMTDGIQSEFNKQEDKPGMRRKHDLRKIIAFELDNELYGVDIAEAAEIMKIPSIMPLPNVPDFILGLINLRGDIVPIVDLRIRFALNHAPWNEDSRIIIMKAHSFLVGVTVERMWRLLRLSPEAFQPPPSGVAKIDPEYFKEVSDVDDRMLIVLDMEKILLETAGK